MRPLSQARCAFRREQHTFQTTLQPLIGRDLRRHQTSRIWDHFVFERTQKIKEDIFTTGFTGYFFAVKWGILGPLGPLKKRSPPVRVPGTLPVDVSATVW